MVGRKPASVLPAPVAATSSALRPRRASSSISSWCRRGRQPLASNQSLTTGGSARSAVVGPLAPAHFLLGDRPRASPARFGSVLPVEPPRITSQISTISRIAGPMMSMIHQLRLRPCFPPFAGTPGFLAYIARNGAIGFLDRVPPRGDLCAPGGRVDRSFAAQAQGADHARPFATMRAAGTARCWRPPETLAIMEVPLRPAERAGARL